MATCATCNTTILFGGVKDGDLRFCNADCRARGAYLTIATQIPEALVRQQVSTIHRGKCPSCKGDGPVDVHKGYRVWSALLMTQWSTQPKVCCASCGNRHIAGELAISTLAGWWGLPWGLLMTPVQIGKNVVGFFSKPDPLTPSADLETLVRHNLAAQYVADQKAKMVRA
jgi:hypothetical protein